MTALSNDAGDQSTDIEAVLDFAGDSARSAAFDHYWTKLKSSSSLIDVNVLRLCVRLLSSRQNDDPSYDQLRDLVIARIPEESDNTERQYLLAKICLGNEQLGYGVFRALVDQIAQGVASMSNDDLESHDGKQKHHIVAYLKFVRSSFWLPSSQHHYLNSELLNAIVKCVGVEGLDEHAHDALSALLDFCARTSVSVTNQVSSEPGNSTIDDSLFGRFEELPGEYFTTKAGPVFRSWLQWVTVASKNGIQIEFMYSIFYWKTLRTGLLTGFADQRKYCLGILRQSLILASKDINTAFMQLDTANKSVYLSQYERFSTLFETIALDRYANQVQACLPELTALLGAESVISPSWVTALLSAALDPKVQDGIRKLIGNWYLEYIADCQSSALAHVEFFIQGFLPWATQGHLFTSTLTSSRTGTSCAHGVALSKAVARLFSVMNSDSDSRRVLSNILETVLETGGKIFSPSVLYLISGLLDGLKIRPIRLETTEANLILRISRLPALPEIAADLLAVYSMELCKHIDSKTLAEIPGYEVLRIKYSMMEHNKPVGTKLQPKTLQAIGQDNLLKDFIERLHTSKHKLVQKEAFGPACGELLAIFELNKPGSLSQDDLYVVLEALWEEADRLEYPRSVIVNIPTVFFHAACIKTCVQSQSDDSRPKELLALMQKVLKHMQRLTEGRSYLLSELGLSLRQACFFEPQIMSILSIEDFLVRFINNPPLPNKEFLFEAVAGEKLETFFPHRGYSSYYGQREWQGYAAIIDLLTRFPNSQLDVAKNVLDRILEPWSTQQPPIPIISKWKNVLQLQSMLLLIESCVNEANADMYLDAFMHALVMEQWPRYRFLLEWTITRIYYHFPNKTDRILTRLAKLNENSPVHIASLMKLALLTAPFLNSEDFALKLMVQLIPFSASPKVQVRHEANWSFPTIFSLAEERGWRTITENPAFRALDNHVRSLDKFITPPVTIRTMKLDAVEDFTLTNIFTGQYLKIETPELERVAAGDFGSLYADDARLSDVEIPPVRIPLGTIVTKRSTDSPVQPKNEVVIPEKATETNPAFFQTKSGFDIASLLPSQGPPSAQQKRPASVVLVASLIDNPTNLGGLSRISESFGLEALYLDDLKKTTHKDFKATSVTSEKHFPIHELKEPGIPEFLVGMKRQGYEVVGIEQTDRSGMLGEELEVGGKGLGTLPKKCVLVLGSEREGITSEVLAAIDRCVEIKTVGVTRSLNVQTAGGIAVYEWWREWGGKV